MKNIYRVYDTYNGRIEWCTKKNLDVTINAMEARLKIKRMDYMALNLKDATLDDIDSLNNWCSDNIEIEKLESVEELINLLNRANQ
jgi:predicted transport protein